MRWVLVLVLLIGGCVSGGGERARPHAEEARVGSHRRDACPTAGGREGNDGSWTVLGAGLRIDTERRLLEFDGEVPIDCHHPATPDVYLELVVCSPDSREHESLVVTSVPASMIHAGLLALGFEPGRPASVRTTTDGVERVPPVGDSVSVVLLTRGDDGAWTGDGASGWITDAETRSERPGGGWVFAGSRVVERGGVEWYDADGAGTVVGLAAFGGETIAYGEAISPTAAVDEPVWIADPRVVPVRGTAVRVRIGPIEASGE